MGFKNIYWGILFFFDFRLQHIDILPDIIGYLLISQGLEKLIPYNKHFAQAKKYCLPLAFLAIFDIYEIKVPMEQFQLEPVNIFLILLGFATFYLDLKLFYNICWGISELAKEHDNQGIEELAIRRWNHYLYFRIVMLIVLTFCLIVPSLIMVIFAPVFVISIFIYVSMMGLMDKAEQTFQ